MQESLASRTFSISFPNGSWVKEAIKAHAVSIHRLVRTHTSHTAEAPGQRASEGTSLRNGF